MLDKQLFSKLCSLNKIKYFYHLSRDKAAVLQRLFSRLGGKHLGNLKSALAQTGRFARERRERHREPQREMYTRDTTQEATQEPMRYPAREARSTR